MSTLHKYFRVVLPNTVDTGTVGEGFVEPREVEDFSALPTNKANSEDKERGRMRWEEILKALKEAGAVDVINVDITGGDENSAPTQVDFTVAFESDKVVFIHDLVTTPAGTEVFGPASDLDLVGSTRNETFTDATEAVVVERAIATALAQDDYTDSREVYDPTTGAGGAIEFLNRFEEVTVSALGTGADHAARMANIEGVGGFTVTQLEVNDN